MDILNRAFALEKRKLRSLTTSDRIEIGREAKELILAINEVYKKSKDTELMDLMKRLTVIKRKVEKRLNIIPTI